jgi:hypothetical protein
MAWLPGVLLDVSPAPGVRHAFLPLIIPGPLSGWPEWPVIRSVPSSRWAGTGMPACRSMPVLSWKN